MARDGWRHAIVDAARRTLTKTRRATRTRPYSATLSELASALMRDDERTDKFLKLFTARRSDINDSFRVLGGPRVSDVDPADVAPRPTRFSEKKMNKELDDIAAAQLARKAPERGPERGPEREGLPAGYRMRADAHYVEQL